MKMVGHNQATIHQLSTHSSTCGTPHCRLYRGVWCANAVLLVAIGGLHWLYAIDASTTTTVLFPSTSDLVVQREPPPANEETHWLRSMLWLSVPSVPPGTSADESTPFTISDSDPPEDSPSLPQQQHSEDEALDVEDDDDEAAAYLSVASSAFLTSVETFFDETSAETHAGLLLVLIVLTVLVGRSSVIPATKTPSHSKGTERATTRNSELPPVTDDPVGKQQPLAATPVPKRLLHNGATQTSVDRSSLARMQQPEVPTVSSCSSCNGNGQRAFSPAPVGEGEWVGHAHHQHIASSPSSLVPTATITQPRGVSAAELAALQDTLHAKLFPSSSDAAFSSGPLVPPSATQSVYQGDVRAGVRAALKAHAATATKGPSNVAFGVEEDEIRASDMEEVFDAILTNAEQTMSIL